MFSLHERVWCLCQTEWQWGLHWQRWELGTQGLWAQLALLGLEACGCQQLSAWRAENMRAWSLRAGMRDLPVGFLFLKSQHRNLESLRGQEENRCHQICLAASLSFCIYGLPESVNWLQPKWEKIFPSPISASSKPMFFQNSYVPASPGW